jgi:hypothetical protein
MNIKTGCTSHPDVKTAVRELKEQLLKKDESTQDFVSTGVVAIIFFASVDYEPLDLVNSFNEEFLGIEVFGASSAVNICNGSYSEHSIVAMALPSSVVSDVKVVTLEDLSQDSDIDLLPSIHSFGSYYGGSFFTLPKDLYFGLVFMTFLTHMEGMLFEQLRRATKIQFSGAVASARGGKATYVCANGRVIRNGALLALFKSVSSFHFDKIENVVPLPYKYVLSGMDNENHLINSLDSRIAAESICSSLEVDIDYLRENLHDYSLGSYIDGIPYLCSMLGITSEGYIKVARDYIPLGTSFGLFKNSADIVSGTSRHIERINENRISLGLLQFQCIFRYNLLQKLNQVSEYESLFKSVPNVGFCTFGEYYISYINMSSTLLVFNKMKDSSSVRSSGKCYEIMQILFKEVAKEQVSSFSYIRTKLMLKGINPDIFGPTTLDNPKHLEILQKFANSMRGL